MITGNRPGFAGLALKRWAHEHAINHRFITPEEASQNGYIKSFNGRLSDECLNEHEFLNPHPAREPIGAYRDGYNLNRPHSALDGPTPSEPAAKIARAPMGAHLAQIGPALAANPTVSKPTTTNPAHSF